MAAIEHVAERLHADTESTDVDMSVVSDESDSKSSSSPLSLSNKLVSSPMDPGNDEFQMKFLVTGTSNRPHHSGKKKVVCIHFSIVLCYVNIPEQLCVSPNKITARHLHLSEWN